MFPKTFSKRKMFFLKIIVLLTLLTQSTSIRILGVFFVQSVSHQNFFQQVWKNLGERGFNLTIFSPNILPEELKNVRQIDVGFTYEITRKRGYEKVLERTNWKFNQIFEFHMIMEKTMESHFKCHEAKKLMESNEKFDVILAENLHPLAFAWAYKFKVPIVGISSLGALLQTHDIMGNPTHPVLSPDFLLNVGGNLSFMEKVQSTLYNIWYRILYHNYILPRADSIARKYFGQDMPYLGDLERNISLLLLNVNPIIHTARPNVPGIIELTQMHIKKKQPLPKALQNILDNSPQGVVYFSLGSNVKSAGLDDKILQTILQALSELPFKVLFKWESDALPNKPSNVFTSKWFPQQDVLGHKNIKVFVTQGGLQSMEETISNEVPVVGMPFFADQPGNVIKMVDLGFAKQIDYVTMSKNDLKEAIIEVATNPKFKANAKRVHDLITDQPMSGLDKAIWWIEYVIRHKGAQHLRSPAADMPWYDYFVLDVITFLLACLCLGLYIIYLIFSIVLRRIRRKIKFKTQ